MALAITGTLSLGSQSETSNAYAPRFLYRSHFRDGTITASSSEEGHAPENVADAFTDTAWIGGEGQTEWWLELDRPGADADFAAMLLWRSEDSNGDYPALTVRVEASDDGQTWSTVAGPIMPVDRVIVFLFDEEQHDYWRLHFEGDEPPQVANAMLGLSTEFVCGWRSGFQPPPLARDNEIMNNQTAQGHLVGKSIVRRGIRTSLPLSTVPASWVRNVWEPFVDHAELRPFYVVWSPARWPDEVAFVWADGEIPPPSYSNLYGHMDVEIDVRGFAK